MAVCKKCGQEGHLHVINSKEKKPEDTLVIYTKEDEDIGLCENCITKVSYSRVGSYLHCPQGHYFSYVEGLKLKKPEKPLSFGKDFHKLLQFRRDKVKRKQAWSEIKEAYHDLPMSYQTELGDDYLDNLKGIFKDYREVWKGQPLPSETEREFLIKILKMPSGEFVWFHGVIDELYEDDLTLGEHKTFSSAPDMAILAMNTQPCLYAKAYKLDTGITLERVRWDYIRSKLSVPPIWLEKTKRLSNAQNNNITPMSWRRSCMEHGLDSPDILALADNYKPNIGNFFFRCSFELIPSMVDLVWDSFRQSVKMVMKYGANTKIKNISRDCGWCGYRPICFAEFTGADVNYVKSTDYVRRKRR